MIFSALLETGDEIIMSNPHYPCYPNYARFLDAAPVFVDTREDEGFQLSAQGVRQKIGPRTRAVLINSPSNPAGTLLSRERMAEIAALGVPVVSDEIYHGLVYGENEHSILEFTQEAFVLNGFSKLYAMTGWRLGFVIVPEDFVRPLQKIQQNFYISAGSVSQWAALAALRSAQPDVERMKRIYDERRRYMIRRLRELGFGLKVEPAGAFYMLANARHLGPKSYDVAFEILERAGVGVGPGIDFGANAEGYLRFSYANSIENIREGLSRLEAFLAKR
jgi:aspartate/methionine/tyrosine aminotransferase